MKIPVYRMFCCVMIITVFLFIEGGVVMAMELKSTAFSDGEYIPREYTGQGQDMSPELIWGGMPEETKSFVLICDDPDAPMGTWVHWVIYNIPQEVNSLAENIPDKATLSNGIKQGENDFGNIGYGGPMPPPGKPHRYFFKLYALDRELDLTPNLTKKEVLDRVQAHIIGKAQLIGLYKR